MPELLSTKEVAEYLRIKERKVYELVRDGLIPCTKVTGKYLFPKQLIDNWLAQSTELPEGARSMAAERVTSPPVVAGSHDPLLEWAIRESGCGLAWMAGGSLDGLRRLAAGEAQLCGMHVLDGEGGSYNLPLLKASYSRLGLVALEWAWREQGLVLAAGNPHGIRGLRDLAEKPVTVVERQPESGSQILFRHLLEKAGIAYDALARLEHPALTESDLALLVAEGRADAGPAIRAAARQYGLDFLPLARERFDLVMRRRDYFEPPIQSLLAFARTERFRTRAVELQGYDIGTLGAVTYNDP
ncbi:MAG TPA: helix-turn-helix transcriptional regulator [Alphaproteobacteria bacterium]|nr:helix-turn-helix transcriptional regulator [Alphaproteobacteria bacterium]